ncbi:MAG: hypothetical protein WAX89_01065 [Alphaproteobacteria bacterium]
MWEWFKPVLERGVELGIAKSMSYPILVVTVVLTLWGVMWYINYRIRKAKEAMLAAAKAAPAAMVNAAASAAANAGRAGVAGVTAAASAASPHVVAAGQRVVGAASSAARRLPAWRPQLVSQQPEVEPSSRKGKE